MEYCRKHEVKMIRKLLKFIIYLSCERPLKNGRIKLKIFGKSSLNFTFGQGSCLILQFARPNSNKAVLVKIFLRFEIFIFDNNFAICLLSFLEPLISSICSMGWVAVGFLLREIIKHISMFYPLCLKKYQKKPQQTR